MHYIIFDLEWNCAFYGKDKHINEIIELGAVLLDENFNEIDRFSQFVRPSKTKKLNKHVKNLTHITDQDVNSAADFKTVLHEFEQFKRQPDTIYMTWSDTDLHVLSENCREILNCESADFIEKYVDLQRYAMRFLKTESKNQVSLANAAEQLEIANDNFNLHRACDDSLLCAKILKKTYEEKQFSSFIRVLNKEYYARLMFKPYYVTSTNDPLFEKKDFDRKCTACGRRLSKIGKIKFFNNSFSQKYYCKHCDKRFKLYVKIKKTFDSSVKNIRFTEKSANQEKV